MASPDETYRKVSDVCLRIDCWRTTYARFDRPDGTGWTQPVAEVYLSASGWRMTILEAAPPAEHVKAWQRAMTRACKALRILVEDAHRG